MILFHLLLDQLQLFNFYTQHIWRSTMVHQDPSDRFFCQLMQVFDDLGGCHKSIYSKVQADCSTWAIKSPPKAEGKINGTRSFQRLSSFPLFFKCPSLVSL